MLIKQIDRDTEKERIARLILESLPEWFGIPQAREEYIAHSRGKPFFCAFEAERPVGFLYLKETGRHTVEVAVMGVVRECHRQGIGRSLRFYLSLGFLWCHRRYHTAPPGQS